ncbi:MAG: alpha-amylase family glycosyl hydrolase [Acidimicrobiia bacterium]
MDIPAFRKSNIWWENRFGYEVYPRTFFDSNGDGIGDLSGIKEKLEYLSKLGIGAIWICPFYKSPLIDCGYDVSDYFDIDPEIGTIKDFENLISVAHDLDIAVLMDIVPNHTSDQHELFQKALADMNSPERDLFIFRDPKPDGSAPNNWLSVFGGSAWTLDEKSGQYYLHLFYPEQPDLNWRNPKVHSMFENILRFWLDKGIDGFRIDVTQGLYKHEDLPDTIEIKELPADATEEQKFANMDDQYYYCLPETPLVFENWKRIASEYNAVLIGEMVETTPKRLAQYFNGKGLDLVTYLASSRIFWEPEKIVEVFDHAEHNFFGQITWMMANHDFSRTVSRFGGENIGLQRALTTTAFTACLSGFPFLYYGEELGWEDGLVNTKDARDPRAIRFPDSISEGRDPVRTNMAWSFGELNQGFSASQNVWLKSEDRKEQDCVNAQISEDTSPFYKYNEIIALRKQIGEIANAPLAEKQWIRTQRFIGYQYNDLICGMNVDDDVYKLDIEGKYDLIYSSSLSTEKTDINQENTIVFPPETTCVYKLRTN